jgi:glutamate carboxypeptidase
VRAWSQGELDRVDDAIRARVPHIVGTELIVHGGINRPPLDPHTSTRLVELAEEAAAQVGMSPLVTASVGGGSDANFCGALGIPTLDGVGACGEGAHARHEWVDVPSLSLRARWLARTWELVVERGLDG